MNATNIKNNKIPLNFPFDFIDLHTHLNILPLGIPAIVAQVFNHQINFHYLLKKFTEKKQKVLFVVNFYQLLPWTDGLETVLKQMENFTNEISPYLDKNVKIIYQKEDLDGDYTIGLIYALESFRWSKNFETELDILFDQGLRALIPVHFSSNRFGGSCNSPFLPMNLFRAKELTDEGKSLIKYLKKKKIILDLSHLHDEAISTVNDIYQAPFMYSHIGVRDFVKSSRNLKMQNIEILHQAGGVMGMIPWKALQKNYSTFLKIVDHLSEKQIESVLAIGTDYGAPINTIKGMDHYENLINTINLSSLTDYLKKGILAQNAESFLQKVLP